MSTEHQQYSTENQSEAIATYATLHGMVIVRTYADHGRSGLNLAQRDGLLALLDDVANKRNDFSVVLVYDISRWGRFQDADESAYYEYILKKAGIRIHYSAEQFANDGSLISVLFKALKRIMAAEYSRELSAKVFAGQSRLTELGFRQGGTAGYGLRRQLVDRDGSPKGTLRFGERKSIHTDRVVLVPGPEEETAIVASIYASFVNLGKGESEIAADLNSKGFKTNRDQPWTRTSVHRVLTLPQYCGMNVFNRRSFKLKTKLVRNPREMWIICERAFDPIVSTEEFQKAQAIIENRYRCWSDQKMLDGLKTLLKTSGRLSRQLIDESDLLPASATYFNRFGGLEHAYSLVGWHYDERIVTTRRALQNRREVIVQSIVSKVEGSGASICESTERGLFIVNEMLTVSIRVVSCL
jgi:DNA invertase Pin-like site-specific DNA recombinase